MTSAHIACPFPPCDAEWTIGLAPGQTRVTVPFHYPSGFEGAERYADLRCPGALAMLDCSTLTIAMTPETAEQMNRAYETYLLWLAKSVDERAADDDLREQFLDEVERRDREQRARDEQDERDRDVATAGPYIGGPVGRPVNYDEHPFDEWFPVKARPDEGPQPGEPPHAPVPAGVEAIHLSGRDEVDDSHAATVGLTRLAITQFGQAQEALAVVTDLLDRATAAAAIAETNVQSANALVKSAVGTGAGKPAPGEQMAEQSRLAVNTLSAADGSNLHNAINLGKIRAELAVQQIAGAVSNAEAYIGLLRG